MKNRKYPIYIRSAGGYFKIINDSKVVEVQECKSINELSVSTYEVKNIVDDLLSNLCNMEILPTVFNVAYFEACKKLNSIAFDLEKPEKK